MKDYLADSIRNVVLLGHSGAGKSSLIEASLLQSKAIERFGKTEDGTSTVDFDPDEIKKGLSIYCALAPVEWKDKKINFIDTPGYLDYEGEKVSGLAVGDNALVVVSGKDGVEAGTISAMKLIKQRHLPTIFFVNKMDDENASFDKVLAQLRDNFGNTVIPFEYPIIVNGKLIGSVNIIRKKAWYYANPGTPEEVPADLKDVVDGYYEQFAEAIASADDALMEKFFEGEEFDDTDIAKGLKAGARSGEIKPVYCGSATQGRGIERILDLVSEYFPSYAEIQSFTAHDEQGNDVELKTTEEEALSALVFKTIVDPFVGRINYVKVTSGVLKTDSTVYNVKKDQVEKVGQIFVVKGKNQIAVGKLFTGDVGALTKLAVTETNDTLCSKEKPVLVNEIVYPKPMLGVAVSPKTKADEDKMSDAIKKVLTEDRSLSFVRNAETGEQVLYALGEQQIDVVQSKLKNRYKVEIVTKEPKIQYRETIRGKSEVQGKYKKQNGGAGQYGDVWVRFEYNPDEEELVFAEEVFGGSVPRNFFPSVEAGLRSCMAKGPLAGCKVVNVKATLYDGSYHPVDSKPNSFEAAAKLAFKKGIPEANPMILEPIGKVSVVCPDEYTGDIIGDFNKRRGMILDTSSTGEPGESQIDAEVPMAEMMKYATELRSMTKGRGTYVIEFDRYEPAPKPVMEKVIAAAAKDLKDDDLD
ncbi:MAG: elongation factor G [Erysipelotrichaceae bacterium]|nr:elongation factor G [Erysipelotrichaceae bacterium]